MPTNLTLRAFQLHQKISNFQLPGFPIRWLGSTRKWKIDCTNNYKNTTIFLFRSAALKFLVLIFLNCCIMFTLRFPLIFKIEHKCVPVLLLQIVFFSIIVDIIFILFGYEMVACCNWCYQAVDLWLRRVIDNQCRSSFIYNYNHRMHGSAKITISNKTGK